MPIDIKNVLVCDAVDPSCVELLKSNGISVDYKLKLPKDVLVAEAKVSCARCPWSNNHDRIESSSFSSVTMMIKCAPQSRRRHR